jgi:hypothetical protein
MVWNGGGIGSHGTWTRGARITRNAALALVLAFTFAAAPSAEAGGACAPVCKTGHDGQRYEWTPGKT